ncbi:MAG: hypothetical protein ACI8QC_000406 [Planctomycetota bacterium]|jgi:hypothetical protein
MGQCGAGERRGLVKDAYRGAGKRRTLAAKPGTRYPVEQAVVRPSVLTRLSVVVVVRKLGCWWSEWCFWVLAQVRRPLDHGLVRSSAPHATETPDLALLEPHTTTINPVSIMCF